MHNHWLFIGNVAAHLVALMSGIASFFIGIYEKGKNRPVATKAFWAIAVLCLLFAFDQAWQDEHRNTQAVIQEKSDAWTKFSTCDKQLAVDEAVLKTNQGTMMTQQALLSGQQDTFNKCMLTLGMKSTPEPPRVDVQWLTMGEQHDKDNKPVSQTLVFVGRTNRPLPEVRHKLKCPFPFKFHTAGLSEKDRLAFLFENGQDSDTEASFSIQRAWQMDQTLVIVTTVATNPTLQFRECTITSKQ